MRKIPMALMLLAVATLLLAACGPLAGKAGETGTETTYKGPVHYPVDRDNRNEQGGSCSKWEAYDESGNRVPEQDQAFRMDNGQSCCSTDADCGDTNRYECSYEQPCSDYVSTAGTCGTCVLKGTGTSFPEGSNSLPGGSTTLTPVNMHTECRAGGYDACDKCTVGKEKGRSPKNMCDGINQWSEDEPRRVITVYNKYCVRCGFDQAQVSGDDGKSLNAYQGMSDAEIAGSLGMTEEQYERMSDEERTASGLPPKDEEPAPAAEVAEAEQGDAEGTIVS